MGKCLPIEHPEQGGEGGEGEEGGDNGEQDRHQTNHLKRTSVRVDPGDIIKNAQVPCESPLTS